MTKLKIFETQDYVIDFFKEEAKKIEKDNRKNKNMV